jgi:hypothetical protein
MKTLTLILNIADQYPSDHAFGVLTSIDDALISPQSDITSLCLGKTVTPCKLDLLLCTSFMFLSIWPVCMNCDTPIRMGSKAQYLQVWRISICWHDSHVASCLDPCGVRNSCQSRADLHKSPPGKGFRKSVLYFLPCVAMFLPWEWWDFLAHWLIRANCEREIDIIFNGVPMVRRKCSKFLLLRWRYRAKYELGILQIYRFMSEGEAIHSCGLRVFPEEKHYS